MFLTGTMNYKYVTETFFQWTINAGNYSSPSNEKLQIYAKMHQNTFGGRALPGPAGGAYALPRISSRNDDLLQQ